MLLYCAEEKKKIKRAMVKRLVMGKKKKKSMFNYKTSKVKTAC